MLSLSEVSALTRGTLRPAGAGALRIDDVSTDSRRIDRGALFVALPGDGFDGHAFLDDVAASGAAAALVESGRYAAGPLPSVVVDDTRVALGDLASGWRRRFRMPLVVVTGSNGKTTTKDMIASIFAAVFGDDGRCATQGNLNNEIGVPLTLLRLRTHHRAAVVEVGMNHPGETTRLAAIAGPDVALVVNAQREHQEFMQSVQAVADEHARAIDALGTAGVAVFPADDPYAGVWRRAAGTRRVVDFSCATTRDERLEPAAVTARVYLEAHDTVVHLGMPDGAVTVRLAVPGLHNARNATAAAAAAHAAGIGPDAIRRGLEAFRPTSGRSQRFVADDGLVVIDDSYNANPDSVRAAIDLLANHAGPRLLVLGDMGEVGSEGPRFHAEVGAHARERGIDALFALGAASGDTVAAFGAHGRHFDAIEPLIASAGAWVAEARNRPATVLVKGSRFMRMERVVGALRGGVASGGAH